MRWSAVTLSAAALVASAAAQDDVETFKYCDELDRCFNAYNVQDTGIVFGVATPEETAEQFDLILQVTASIQDAGWVGMAMGGSMTYNPLAIVWPNGDDVQISSRMAFGYFVPPAFEDTTFTVLPGTTVNETHYRVTALCQGCSYWAPFDAEPVMLNGEGENYFAFAYSGVPVDDPASIDTTFGIHERVGHWIHNLADSKTADFDIWAAETGEGGEETEQPPAEEEEPPVEEEEPPVEEEEPPVEEEEPPVEEEEPPVDEEQPPVEEEQPADGEAPADEEEPPAEGETPTEDGDGDGESPGDSTASSTATATTVLTTPTTPAEEPVAALPLPTSCPGVPANAFPLSTAEGWSIVKISGSVRTPRAVVEDSSGNLLVLEAGVGLSVHTVGADGCISSSKSLIANPQLNHGLHITPDGTKIYVSSMTTAWEWAYDAEAQEVSAQRIVVKNMYTGGHPTRSLVIPPATPNLLVMQLGSNSNFDMESLDIKTARANVKVFDVAEAPEGGWDWITEGWDLGYGLRNDIALVVDGNNMVWSAENSADNLARTADGQTVDVHIDNPAEELNFLGDPSKPNTDWYGYPVCFTIYEPNVFVDTTFNVGDQFVLAPNTTYTDDNCKAESIPPRLSFRGHSAPIDAAFDKDFANMYVTLHGSWNRAPATGYKVVQVPFTTLEDGSYDPVASADDPEGYTDIAWNDDVDACTGNTCLRPSGITWDKAGTRMYLASDNARSGELFVLYRTEAVNDAVGK